MSSIPRSKTPDEAWESMPSAEDIWPGDRYQYAPVEKYIPDPNAERTVVEEVEDRECERLLVNMRYDPPITDEQIFAYAEMFNMDWRKAQDELRRKRI